MSMHNQQQGPRFKQGDKVIVHLGFSHPYEDKVGTVARTPKRRSRGFMFGGSYSYDVEFSDRGPQRLREDHLLPEREHMSKPKFKIGDRVSDEHLQNFYGTVISVGPSPHFVCEVRWDEPKWMDGEDMFVEPVPQDCIFPAPAAQEMLGSAQ